jgi:hypothetical protein
VRMRLSFVFFTRCNSSISVSAGKRRKPCPIVRASSRRSLGEVRARIKLNLPRFCFYVRMARTQFHSFTGARAGGENGKWRWRSAHSAGAGDVGLEQRFKVRRHYGQRTASSPDQSEAGDRRTRRRPQAICRAIRCAFHSSILYVCI